jgi:hypothetical protein
MGDDVAGVPEEGRRVDKVSPFVLVLPLGIMELDSH